ncbi:YciI family protein [Rhizobium sp. Root1220]|uniref:YciI family protein n=1 Tax=Rhizobium sp. Root1220 TaxID=1736432 RepID=UPI0006F43403|nr:YciI family protein [Rhizobium sp. Root1220]KQV63871.1 dehydrogenase [Rhizobium sp. Root1220]
MRYVCLIYNSADIDGTQTRAEAEETVREHFRLDEQLLRDGTLIYADALEMPDKGSVLRVRNNEFSITDGPYVETKEHLAGLYVIEAADLEEARSVVARIPCARVGAVEIRPVRVLTFPE